MIDKIDYSLFSQQYEYGEHNRLSLWIHPLWTRKDLGEGLADRWKSHLEEIAKDPNYALILIQPEMPKAKDESERIWRNRLNPLINSLPNIFNERFFHWYEDFPIEGRNQEHIKLIKERFKVKPIARKFYYANDPEKKIQKKILSKNMLFLTCELDGLYRDMCVEGQRTDISGISLYPEEFWD